MNLLIIAFDSPEKFRRVFWCALEAHFFKPRTLCLRVNTDSVKVKGKAEMEIPADTVIMAVGSRSNHQLAEELTVAGYQVKVIGDAEKVATVLEAVAQGYEIGRNL